MTSASDPHRSSSGDARTETRDDDGSDVDGGRSRDPAPAPAPAGGTSAAISGAAADPAGRARAKAAAAHARAEATEALIRTNGRLRIGAFLLGAGPLLLLETSPRELWPALLAVAAVSAALFVYLVRRQRRLSATRDRDLLRKRLRHESLARMARRWDEAPWPSLAGADPHHPYAADLDVLGRGSLAHLLGRVGTAPGRAALSRALLDPLTPLPERGRDLFDRHRPADAPPAHRPQGAWHEALRARQRAVDRLAAEPDLLDELELAAREVAGTASGGRTLAFLEWAAGEPWLRKRGWAIHGARALSVLNLATLGAWFAGWLSPPVWIFGLAGAYALNRTVGGEADARFGAAEGGEHDPARWAALLERAGELPRDDPTLARLLDVSRQPAPGAARALGALRRITDVAAVRYSGLAHFPLAALFAWDVHVLHRLEGWQVRYGAETEAWVRTVAELELLVALAGLRHEHPAWSFPEFREAAGCGIEGGDLGHPLLPPDRCVGNQVELPAPGRLLLVTGSNMAGKTTLLRALGANQVLGLIGAPVAARRLVTRPVLPWTAMRVSDSLTEGVSFFMAELRRLHRVVEAARSGPTLFLLDEILQGTNTAERRTAARIVLRHLLDTDAVGAVTTHDLTLADAPDLKERSVEIHFREEVIEEEGGRRLHFDYQLRPGPATSRNALLLLEMVGLGPSGEGDGERRSDGPPRGKGAR